MSRDWIRTRLKKIGKKQAAFFRAIDLPSSRVAQIIDGKQKFRADQIVNAARFLELTVEQFVSLLADQSPEMPPALRPAERKLLELFAEMSQEDRDRLLQTAASWAGPKLRVIK